MHPTAPGACVLFASSLGCYPDTIETNFPTAEHAMSDDRPDAVANRDLPILGVDTGGTFTDFVLVTPAGVRTYKLPSTRRDPAQAVLTGLYRLLGDRPALVVHGTTVATNALLEGKSTTVALVTTRGFRDLLEIGRQNRPELYALHVVRGRALVDRSRVVEVAERVRADGGVLDPLDPAQVARVVQSVKATGAESVAICLLHAYANPTHEHQLARALEAAGLFVSASHRILPEYREFERAATTAVNATISPIMQRYLERLDAIDRTGTLRVMQSNGGTIGPRVAGSEAVRTLLSGPAAGVVGAQRVAAEAGFDRIITFDMGGTSTDVCLCDDEIPMTMETHLAGWPIRVPMIEIHTVGAGGGSLARLDPGGALVVGPESVGAEPGPACYGTGWDVAVTDANLYLGRIVPAFFAGGHMRLHPERAAEALRKLGEQVGLSPERVAEGILEVVETTMAGALRVVSVQRGHDPREFTLVPFGGAGGLHACSLAEALGMTRILVPPAPGLLSARGLVMADVVKDYSQTVLGTAYTSPEAMAQLFERLETVAQRDMADEGVAPEKIRFERMVDMRYEGQSFELIVPFADDLDVRFHEHHERRYGFASPGRAVEAVTVRLRAVGPRTHQMETLSRSAPASTEPWRDGGGLDPHGVSSPGPTEPGRHDAADLGKTRMYVQGTWQSCPMVDRASLEPGDTIAGPALVVEATATLLILPGWSGRVDKFGNILMEAS